MGCFFIFVREIFKSVYHWFLLIPLFLLQERPQFQTIYTSWTAVSVGRFCFLGYAGGSTCLTQQVVLEPIGSDLSFCIDKGFLGSGFWQYLRLLNILANLIFTPVAFEESFGFFLYLIWPNLVTLFPEDLLLLFSSGILHPIALWVYLDVFLLKMLLIILGFITDFWQFSVSLTTFPLFLTISLWFHEFLVFYHWFLTIFGKS